MVVLGNLKEVLGDESACSTADVLHVFAPVVGKMIACDFARAEGGCARHLGEAGKYGGLECLGGGVRFSATASIRAVTNLVPTGFPFFPPSDAPTAGGAGLFGVR